ncbi:ReoY family proteolytic degradation factor [Sporosarcina thermotolerans]|uniref:ReoY family proteolytic degradation factor n=1 Tax=Sporosarcina thermotolerans TaxID=633404 RepID=UPI0024BBFBFD|nr:ReoY family proteolytic degradation factor [Sporosarcina thermotolerans]WHT47143.1 ReoY family proteolytic degradation factor [Sporosarcina thermotolerans]
MTAMVPVAAKKDFVRWFLKRYKLKRRECVWILNYLLSHEQLLQNVHFTDEVHYCPRAMVISTINSESIPFRFYKGNLMTADAEKSFHDLRLHPDEKMFIQLNFPNSNTCPHYASVREENPFLPAELQVSPRDRKIAEKLLEESAASMSLDLLMKRVDEALDANDRERFLVLSAMLNDMKIIKD